MSDQPRIKELYLALLTEGWTPPHMARQRDYPTRSELKAADQAAMQANCESLGRALALCRVVVAEAVQFDTRADVVDLGEGRFAMNTTDTTPTRITGADQFTLNNDETEVVDDGEAYRTEGLT